MSWLAQVAGLDDACAETFGQVVLYSRSADDPGLPVLAVFEEDAVTATFHEPADGTALAVASVEPVLYIARANLAFVPEEGHSIAVDGVLYRVSVCEPDGPTGWRLILKRVRVR